MEIRKTWVHHGKNLVMLKVQLLPFRLFKNLNSIAANKNIKSDELKSFAQKLFEEINLCGYRTGYDSARCDYEEEGL